MENSFLKMKNTDLDWNDLKYFLAVAREGGLSAAALKLGGSASTVSRHISALENRLGVKLFLRQQTGYLLTDQGTSILMRVTEVENAMLTVERNGDQLQSVDEVSGLIRLAAAESLASYLIMPHMPEFLALYPKMQVELLVGALPANLARREADVALRYGDSIVVDNNQDYITHFVGYVHFAPYCQKSLLADLSAEQDPWKTLPIIELSDCWAYLPMVKWLKQITQNRAPLIKGNTLHTQYVAVRCGLGITLLPEYVGDIDDMLVKLDAPSVVPSRELWLVYHRDLKASQRVLAMKDFLIKLLAKVLDSKV
ncbi:LysR family transcriptional regulator [Iodobacter sp.]|uniref:LysR family transcriptional regulator n=2 Tax=unclassified Iodobacter TaxID=235634 RepID=UPI0025E784D8|nr:LysR family transcriptional regulator [Iodobacter sp.]